MQMSFSQYIDNPLGKRNAVFSQRDMFKALYTEKFNKVMLREAGKINYRLYHNKKDDMFYCHIKIPSEVVPKFYYDVVIQFYTDNNALRTSGNLDDYYVRFYSNDPAFVFTYLRVFLKNEMFVEDLKAKSSNLALKEDPKIRNPYEIPGYVKSLYFAYLYMKLKVLFLKTNYTMYGSPYDKKILIDTVEHADKKIADRQEGEEKLKKQQSKEKSSKIDSYNKERIQRLNQISKNTNGVISITPTVKSTGISKASNNIKRSKTTKRI